MKYESSDYFRIKTPTVTMYVHHWIKDCELVKHIFLYMYIMPFKTDLGIRQGQTFFSKTDFVPNL